MAFSPPENIQHLMAGWQELIWHPQFWWEVGGLILVVVASLLLGRSLKSRLEARREQGNAQGLQDVVLKSLQRIVFPLSMLLGVLLVRGILLFFGQPVELLDVAIPLLLSLAAIRILVYVLRKTFRPGPVVKAWENIIATFLWVAVTLHFLGWLPTVRDTLGEMVLEVGKLRISMLDAAQLILTLALLWLLALWLARIIEGRLSQTSYLSLGMRLAMMKLTRFLLVALAVLLALNAVDIDLTVLAVFGGALGVSLGLGLQHIASNFISGFVVLFDRSIRPGDVITIGDTIGTVQEIHARYVVVRDREGVDRLIPNTNLITNDVINWSFADHDVRVKVPVPISYADDPELALDLLMQAAKASPRVLDEPVPQARLMGFGERGIDLELRVWIKDPQEGLAGVRSDINLAIWHLFKEAGITIPYPQRDLHIRQYSTGMPADIGDN